MFRNARGSLFEFAMNSLQRPMGRLRENFSVCAPLGKWRRRCCRWLLTHMNTLNEEDFLLAPACHAGPGPTSFIVRAVIAISATRLFPCAGCTNSA